MKENESIKKTERLSTAVRKRLFLEALRKSLGVISTAMKAVGIESPATIKNWRDRDVRFAERMREVEDYAGDFVETQLYKAIQRGDVTATIFYCKTKLRNRGYAERTELTGKDGKDLMPQKSDEDLIAEIRELQRKLEL